MTQQSFSLMSLSSLCILSKLSGRERLHSVYLANTVTETSITPGSLRSYLFCYLSQLLSWSLISAARVAGEDNEEDSQCQCRSDSNYITTDHQNSWRAGVKTI